jgi:glutathione S-transferase
VIHAPGLLRRRVAPPSDIPEVRPAYRVRIALNLKSLPYDMESIHLTKDGGHQHTPEFRAVNPQMRVPALELSSGEVLTQ